MLVKDAPDKKGVLQGYILSPEAFQACKSLCKIWIGISQEVVEQEPTEGFLHQLAVGRMEQKCISSL